MVVLITLDLKLGMKGLVNICLLCLMLEPTDKLNARIGMVQQLKNKQV